MPYDDHLATRVRALLSDRDDVEEQPMFGGLAFMIRGHMACGIMAHDLMVRVGTAAYVDAMAQPHVRAMDFTHRPMPGMVYVGATGIRSDGDLRRWIDRGIANVTTLPAKETTKTKPAAKKKAAAKKPAAAKKKPAAAKKKPAAAKKKPAAAKKKPAAAKKKPAAAKKKPGAKKKPAAAKKKKAGAKKKAAR